MPVTLTAIGIQSVDITLVESFELEKKTELKSVNASNGGFGAAETVDPIFELSIQGRGDLPAGLALGIDATTEITPIVGGVTIIERVRQTQSNEDFQTWEVSGKNFPGAS
jgi:hypothetical protein